MSSDKSGRFGKPVWCDTGEVGFWRCCLKKMRQLELDQVCFLWSMKPVKFLVAAMKISQKRNYLQNKKITTARPSSGLWRRKCSSCSLRDPEKRGELGLPENGGKLRPWGLWDLDPNQWGISDISHRKSLPVIFGILDFLQLQIAPSTKYTNSLRRGCASIPATVGGGETKNTVVGKMLAGNDMFHRMFCWDAHSKSHQVWML